LRAAPKGTAQPRRSTEHVDLRDLVTVSALAVAAHATALQGGYVWLDHAHLEDGVALAAPGDVAGLFQQGFAGTGFYRPLVALSLSLDAWISKDPLTFRIVTLAWHVAASAMVLATARALSLPARAALLAGVLFAVHPATSVVASATAFRSEAMMLVFLLGLVAAHRWNRPLLAGTALLLGALTKETAWVLAPLFVLALELGSFRTRVVKRRLLAAEALAFTLATALRLAFAPPFRARHVALPFDEALGTRLAAFHKSGLALVAPVDPGICDAFPVTSLLSVPALLGGAMLGLSALLAFRRRGPAILFALSLLPVLQLVPVMRFWSPHYVYAALAFGAMLLAELVTRAGRRAEFAAAAAILVMSVVSFRDGRRYASDRRLFEPEVSAEPGCREAQFFLAESAREAGALDVAAVHYQRALAGRPGMIAYLDELATLQNLGAVELARGHHAEARDAWSRALQRSSSESEARRISHNLAVLTLITSR
jgi:protein O-mannosyl-transferase